MSVFSSFAQSGERHFAALFGSRCILLIIQKAGGIQQLALINTMCNTDDWLWTSPSWPPPPHCDDDSIDAWLTLLNFICRLVNIAVNILCAKEIPQIMVGNFKPAASNIWSLSLLTQTLCMLHAAILFCIDDDENDAVSSYATAVLRMDQEWWPYFSLLFLNFIFSQSLTLFLMALNGPHGSK